MKSLYGTRKLVVEKTRSMEISDIDVE